MRRTLTGDKAACYLQPLSLRSKLRALYENEEVVLKEKNEFMPSIMITFVSWKIKRLVL